MSRSQQQGCSHEEAQLQHEQCPRQDIEVHQQLCNITVCTSMCSVLCVRPLWLLTMLNQLVSEGFQWSKNGESSHASNNESMRTYLVAGPLERTPPLLLHPCAHISVECEARLPTGLQLTICQARSTGKALCTPAVPPNANLTCMHSVVGSMQYFLGCMQFSCLHQLEVSVQCCKLYLNCLC